MLLRSKESTPKNKQQKKELFSNPLQQKITKKKIANASKSAWSGFY